MDSSEFPASLGPLSLRNKPLIGDLPAGSEFGEDLLASQTASIPQAATVQSQEMEWEVSKQATSDGSLDFGMGKAGDLSTLSKSNSLALSKPSTLDILETPGLLDSLSKGGGREVLEKSGDPDGLFRACGSGDPENGTGAPPVPGTERLAPEALKEGGSKAGMEEESHGKHTGCAPHSSAEEDPEVVEVSSVPPSQEAAASPGSPPPSPQLAKKPRLKSPRKISLEQKENALTPAEEEKDPTPNSVPESVPPPLPPLEGAEGSLSAAKKESGPREAEKGRETGGPPSLAGGSAFSQSYGGLCSAALWRATTGQVDLQDLVLQDLLFLHTLLTRSRDPPSFFSEYWAPSKTPSFGPHRPPQGYFCCHGCGVSCSGSSLRITGGHCASLAGEGAGGKGAEAPAGRVRRGPVEASWALVFLPGSLPSGLGCVWGQELEVPRPACPLPSSEPVNGPIWAGGSPSMGRLGSAPVAAVTISCCLPGTEEERASQEGRGVSARNGQLFGEQ